MICSIDCFVSNAFEMDIQKPTKKFHENLMGGKGENAGY